MGWLTHRLPPSRSVSFSPSAPGNTFLGYPYLSLCSCFPDAPPHPTPRQPPHTQRAVPAAREVPCGSDTTLILLPQVPRPEPGFPCWFSALVHSGDAVHVRKTSRDTGIYAHIPGAGLSTLQGVSRARPPTSGAEQECVGVEQELEPRSISQCPRRLCPWLRIDHSPEVSTA